MKKNNFHSSRKLINNKFKKKKKTIKRKSTYKNDKKDKNKNKRQKQKTKTKGKNKNKNKNKKQKGGDTGTLSVLGAGVVLAGVAYHRIHNNTRVISNNNLKRPRREQEAENDEGKNSDDITNGRVSNDHFNGDIPKTIINNSESPKLNLGVFIVGYPGEDKKYLDSFTEWKTVFDGVTLFTDTRLDEHAKVWCMEHGAIDLAKKKIPILDWYVETARPFLNDGRDGRYITYYSDLCRWYVINILNEQFPSDINGYTQASYLYVQEEGMSPAALKQQLKSESMNNFVIYGNDRNFMLDGEIELRKSGGNFLKRLCLSFDMSYEYLLRRGHFQNFNIYPFDRMIKVSIENPHLDSKEVRNKWENELRAGWRPEFEKLEEMLKSDSIPIEDKKLDNFIETMPDLFAGMSFVRNIKDKIKIKYPNQKFAPFFKRMEKGPGHWTFAE